MVLTREIARETVDRKGQPWLARIAKFEPWHLLFVSVSLQAKQFQPHSAHLRPRVLLVLSKAVTACSASLLPYSCFPLFHKAYRICIAFNLIKSEQQEAQPSKGTEGVRRDLQLNPSFDTPRTCGMSISCSVHNFHVFTSILLLL